ncbi:Hypothetical protein DEACI_0627, partial [Acididesulfobacillus acetoxydans]
FPQAVLKGRLAYGGRGKEPDFHAVRLGTVLAS